MYRVLESILPVFLLILLGLILKRKYLLPSGSVKGFTWLVFHVTVPALLFRNIAINNTGGKFDIRIWIAIFIVTLIFALIPLFLFIKALPERRGVLAQGAYRSNMVFVGLPILQSYIGNQSEIMAAISMVIALTVPVYNLLAVIVLLIPMKNIEGGKIGVSKILKDVALNPLILGSVAGMAYSLSGVPLPGFLDRTLGLIGGISAPLALISVGLSLDLSGAWLQGPVSIGISAIKLILYPAAIYGLLKFWGVSPAMIFPIIILTGSPTAVVSHIMAVEMGGDGKLAASVIAVSTILSIFTLSGWLSIWQWMDAGQM